MNIFRYAEDSSVLETKILRFFESGKIEESLEYSQESGKEIVKTYYESGTLKSEVASINEEVVLEKYYSEDGKKSKKPLIKDALPQGGLSEWNQFLSENLTYPTSARRAGLEGKVLISITILENGEVEDIEIVNPEENRYLLNQEALRVVENYPYQWTPMSIDGKTVKSRRKLPINFKLSN